MGCQSVPERGHDADTAAIRLLSEEWGRALSARDVPRLLSMMTDDAVLLAPGMPPIEGRAAARALYESVFQRFDRIDQTVSTQEIIVSGDWACSWGTEATRLTVAGTGAMVELKGSGMAVMRRERDGTWKFARAINNELPGAPSR